MHAIQKNTTFMYPLAIAILLVSALFTTGCGTSKTVSEKGTESKNVWADLSSPDGAWSAHVPGTPEHAANSFPTPYEKMTNYDLYTVKDEYGSVYTIAVNGFSDGAKITDTPEIILQKSLQSLVDGNSVQYDKMELVSSKVTALADHPALDFAVKNPTNETISYGRFIWGDRTVYALMRTSPGTDADAGFENTEYKTFVKGFVIE